MIGMSSFQDELEEGEIVVSDSEIRTPLNQNARSVKDPPPFPCKDNDDDHGRSHVKGGRSPLVPETTPSNDTSASESEEVLSDSEVESVASIHIHHPPSLLTQLVPEDFLSEENEDDDDDDDVKSACIKPDEENTRFESLDLHIAPDTHIAPLGRIQNIMQAQMLVESSIPGDRMVLDMGTPVLFESRAVIGKIRDTFGPVHKPFYLVQLTAPLDPSCLGRTAYHVPDYSVYALTEKLKSLKGCDASNNLDHEVDSDEADFSDDEKEKAHFESLKSKRPRVIRNHPKASPRHPTSSPASSSHPFQTTPSFYPAPTFSNNDFTQEISLSEFTTSTPVALAPIPVHDYLMLSSEKDPRVKILAPGVISIPTAPSQVPFAEK